MNQSNWQKLKPIRWKVDVLPGVAVIAAIALARFTGTLQFLELTTLDGMLRLRPAEPLDEQVVIIGINDKDINAIGKYPISDQVIADLLTKLQTYDPAVIGLDLFRDIPKEPGHATLSSVFRSSPNVIGIEQTLPGRDWGTVPPPAALPPNQVGFADTILDPDSYVRRSLLSTFNPQGKFRLSLTLQLAKAYLAQRGISLENGIRDPEAFRFGATELTRVQPDSGGYVGADDGGNQILLNFRSGPQPFRMLSLTQIQQGEFKPEWLQRRIVLIGMTALSARDIFSTGGISGENGRLLYTYGVEIQAHAVSQLINAVLHGRPLLKSWDDGWDYLWIISWGLLGIGLGTYLRSPWKAILALLLLCLGLMATCFGLLLLGWWVPLVPTLLVLLLNGLVLTIASFYRYEQDLKQYEQEIHQLQDRQLVIEHTFDAIHNGPLQTLARILREAQEQQISQPFVTKLQHLNRELRNVYDAVRQEILDQKESIRLGSDLALNLQTPLAELLHEVYYDTLKREFPGFSSLKVQVVKLEPPAELNPSVEIKRGLCRFLEEALCNVGKHAVGATRLSAMCVLEGDRWVLRVADNGQVTADALEKAIREPRWASASGFGTRQANYLAKQLGGTFKRFPNHPQGMVTELSWPR